MLVLAVSMVCVVLIVALMLRHQEAAEQRWALERRELLTRIQHPQIVPQAMPRFDTPDPEPDGSELVGTIHYDDNEVT